MRLSAAVHNSWLGTFESVRKNEITNYNFATMRLTRNIKKAIDIAANVSDGFIQMILMEYVTLTITSSSKYLLYQVTYYFVLFIYRYDITALCFANKWHSAWKLPHLFKSIKMCYCNYYYQNRNNKSFLFI